MLVAMLMMFRVPVLVGSVVSGLAGWATEQPATQPQAPGKTQPEKPIDVATPPPTAPPLEIKVRDPNAKPVAPAARPAGVPGQINTADDLLIALETADANLRSLKANISYDRTFEIAGDRQVREGTLYFQSRPQGEHNDRKFAIVFDKLIVGQRLQDKEVDPTVVKQYIFDGQWLVEKVPGEKPPLFNKRQVVPPGERFDPLRIGEGPMPIPIGQRREDILARYNAELVPAEDGLADEDHKDLVGNVKDCYQLKLVPRADRADQDEFREIRLWYRRGAGAEGGKDKPGQLLPRMARTINRSGDESVVQLINVELNGAIPESIMSTATPDPKDGWDVQVIPYRQGLKDDR